MIVYCMIKCDLLWWGVGVVLSIVVGGLVMGLDYLLVVLLFFLLVLIGFVLMINGKCVVVVF